MLDWRTLSAPEAVLESIALEDIWGISRRWAEKLQSLGITNALALRGAEPKNMRQAFGVVMERIVNELRGISCIPLEEMPPPKKQILTSRSFGERLIDYRDLSAAISHFAVRSAEKLRQQQLTTRALTVFIETSRFDVHGRHYANSATTVFELPTHDSAQLLRAANRGLRHIFKAGYSYQRAGVLLPDLLPVGVVQMSLLDTGGNPERSENLMAALDSINRRHGKKTIRFAGEMISNRWYMRQQFKSPSYTTRWPELLTISI